MIDERSLCEILLLSLKELIKRDYSLIEKRIREESINHRLAVYLEGMLQTKLKNGSDYNVDVEYDKHYSDSKAIFVDNKKKFIRPDVLIHQRDSDDNLLAIEAKKGYPTSHDTNKLCRLLEPPYNYHVTAFVSYLPNRKYIKVKIRTAYSVEELRIHKIDGKVQLCSS